LENARSALQIWSRIGRIPDKCDWNSFSIPDLLSFVRVAFPLRPPEIFGHRKRYAFCVSKGNESLRYLRMVAVIDRAEKRAGSGSIQHVTLNRSAAKRLSPTAFGTTKSLDEEKALFQKTVKETIDELGADSP